MSRNVLVFDLDDTLYKEIDFLRSAYWYIATILATGHEPQFVFDEMMSAYYRHDNVFKRIISDFCPNESVEHLLSAYRNHFPHITLSPQTERTLCRLSELHTLAIITDGRSVTQRNKISALRLERFFRDADILISEETGYEKPSEQPFVMLMDKYPHCSYCYIGDNTSKDFIAPNKLGWNTICLKDNGQNIHPQDFCLPAYFRPKNTIDHLSSLFAFFV